MSLMNRVRNSLLDQVSVCEFDESGQNSLLDQVSVCEFDESGSNQFAGSECCV